MTGAGSLLSFDVVIIVLAFMTGISS